MLERHVEVREQARAAPRALRRDQFDDLVDVRIRVHVVEPHPGVVLGGKRAEFARQLEHPGSHRASVDETGAVAQVDAVGAGVLRHDDQFAHPGLEQRACLIHHVADRRG